MKQFVKRLTERHSQLEEFSFKYKGNDWFTSSDVTNITNPNFLSHFTVNKLRIVIYAHMSQ